MSNISKSRRRRSFRKPKHEDSWSLTSPESYGSHYRRIWDMPSDLLLPVFPFCMEDEVRVGDYWYKDNFTRYLLIVVCLKGSILFQFADGDVVLTRGHVLVVPQGTSYLLKNADAAESRKVVLELIGNNLASDMQTLGLTRTVMLKMKNYLELADIILEIGELMYEKRREDIPQAVGLSYRLCTILSMFLHQSDPPDTLLHRAQMLLESDFEKRLTIAMLTETLNCSAAFLNRLFRKELGVTPMQYRQEKKIACARYLLCSTGLTIKEIAFKLGYCDPFYFSNEFRRLTGEAPGAVRKKKALI